MIPFDQFANGKSISKTHFGLELTCILIVFLLVSCEVIATIADTTLTSFDFINRLQARKVERNFMTKKSLQLKSYSSSLELQHKRAKLQYNALSFAANFSILETAPLITNNTTNSTKVVRSAITLISQRAYNKALTKNLQQLQSLTNTKRENTIINVAMSIQNKLRYDRLTSLLTGLEKTMNSTINPIPFTQPLVSGSQSYFNVNSTSINFRSPSTEPSRERMFMCTGDSFGIHIDPTTRVLYSWGNDTLGRTRQLSNSIPLPVDLTLSSNEYIKQVACGPKHAIVLTNSAIYTWGTNANGECGTGNFNSVALPVKIKTHPKNINFINAGPYNSVYIDNTGVAYTWGRGLECQIGSGSTTSSSLPFQIPSLKFTKICFGRNHAVGRTTSGSIYYWGQRKNQEGVDSYSIPTVLNRYTYDTAGKVNGTYPVNQCTPTIFTSDFFTFFAAGIIDFQCGDSSTLVLMNTGRVFGWGNNYYGQLGTDSVSNVNPLAISLNNIGTSRKIVKIFHKNEQSFAIADDQTVWAWGRNDDYVCNIGNGRLNGMYGCTWSSNCRYGCAAQTIPDLLINPTPTYDYVHEIHIMKEASILAYTYYREMGFYAGGKFPSSFFSNGYTGYRNFYTKVHIFDIDYIVPYEKYFPILDRFNMRIMYSENNFLSFSPDNMDMIMVDTSKMTVNIGKATMDMFGAYSFYNTHDFSIDNSVYYFGGIVNNTVSDRIILKTSMEGVQYFNQTLPYPVAGGMLAIVDDYLYIIGGLTDDRGTLIPTYKVMRSQLSNILVWEEIPQVLPRAIYNGVAQVIGDYIYIFGGRTGRLAINADILYASVADMVWQNSYMPLPYPYSESNLFSDNTYIYMTGGFGPTYSEMKGISRALKSDPLTWEDIGQKLPMPTMGITSTLIIDNKLNLFSVDLPQNFLNTNPNVPITIHSIYFANEAKPYVAATVGSVITLQVLDNAFIVGNVLRSCREYKDLIPTADTGVYWIKPSDTLAKFKVYCDMGYLNGGWTLVSTRSSAVPITVPSTDYVKPDYSGYTITDDKWAALRSLSSDLLWRDTTGYYTVASIATLSTAGTYVCKTLSTTLLDSELYRMEDNLPCNYGTDTCKLGGVGTSAGVTSYCGSINVFNPFKTYTFPVPNFGGTKASVYIR